MHETSEIGLVPRGPSCRQSADEDIAGVRSTRGAAVRCGCKDVRMRKQQPLVDGMDSVASVPHGDPGVVAMQRAMASGLRASRWSGVPEMMWS